MMMKALHILLPLALAALPTLSPASGIANTTVVMPPDSIKNTGVSKDSVATDTIVHALKEFEVEGSNMSFRPGEASYTPTRKMKNASADAISLLRRMHIPQLRETPNGVASATGLPIRYFINGHPATAEDLTSMNMNDVRKVLCLDHPADARYLGEPFVVDFIVHEYESGGYSKFYAGTVQLSSNQYTEQLTSKWTYRRMTYDLCVTPSQNHYRWNSERSEETYTLPQGEVTREVIPESFSRFSLSAPVQVRAIYSHGDTYISNRLGYAFGQNKDMTDGGREVFSGIHSGTTEYLTQSPARSNSVNWNGNLTLTPAEKWKIGAEYYAYYTHYDNRYSYTTSRPLEIDRNVRQDALNALMSVTVTRTLANRHTVYAKIMGGWYHSKATYTGDFDEVVTYDWPKAYAEMGYKAQSGVISADVYAGVGYEHSDIDGRSITTIYPYGMAEFTLRPNRNHYMTAWVQYSTFTPTLNTKNPAMSRVSEFMYQTGNPDLKPYPALTAALNYTWNLSKKVYLSLSANMAHLYDRVSRTYSITGDGNGVLRGFANTGGCTRITISPNATFILFNRSLLIRVTPTLRIEDPGKESYFKGITGVRANMSATLYLGKFNISARYFTPYRQFTSQEMYSVVKTRNYYSIEGGWGNGDLNVTLGLYNIFNRSWEGNTTLIESPVYSSYAVDINNQNRQLVRVTLAYTISYGKKIQQRDNLSGNVSGAGSVL